MSSQVTLEKITNLCKRRGLIFQSSELYGGFNGFWDYGPYGTAMRRAVEATWWDYMVEQRENVVGQDSTIICHPQVWKASGHVDQFADIMVDNKDSKKRYRIDNLLEQQSEEILAKVAELMGSTSDIGKLEAAFETKLQEGENIDSVLADAKVVDPSTDKVGDWTPPRQFNLMMQTYVGPVFSEENKAYLRAETCQPIFVNFQTICNSTRQKLPFGIAQTGKAFRNEINPRNFTFRSREFNQMEMEFFCHSDDSMDWYNFWRDQRLAFYSDVLKFKPESMRTHDHDKLAHYAKAAMDIEFEFPFGWGELEGIHHRGTWDLSQHAEFSGQKQEYFDQGRNEKYIPTVVETSVGLDRLMLALLCEAYDEDEAETAKDGKEVEGRVVMRFPAIIAPVQVAILPLSKKLGEGARELHAKLKPFFRSEYDEAQSIGKRYRRQDEIGTPFCLTFDFDSLEDNCVTVRERDTMSQERVAIDQLANYLMDKIRG
ncbi:glycyl-tRNA synthetase [Lentisphaera araneosa HTCC2155]|uniref:Glycine--tRNA ligase n=1 Tax=Lentisphaera araneosa HTCC2155 TaxID=313628 RepID=A6DF46_9BACT|nr:glycine--tRNA ligase [Lentisphaera araneosa]EDM29426.1 glycyl-tRNA synthetase [Lentisphaera araneosa HTCC2155]